MTIIQAAVLIETSNQLIGLFPLTCNAEEQQNILSTSACCYQSVGSVGTCL